MDFIKFALQSVGMSTLSILIAGFALGISLIVAIGPQNALLLKQGIKRDHVWVVIAICAVSDTILILGGTAGVGYLVDTFPTALVVLKYLGAAYLAYFTYLCFRDAFRDKVETLSPTQTEPNKPQQIETFDGGISSRPSDGSSAVVTASRTKAFRRQMQKSTWLKPALATLAICWLNPAAYVDVLVMIGGLANQYGAEGRWLFAAGAVTASLLWFPIIGLSAAKFSHVLSRPAVWRGINFGIGCIMIGLTIKLLLS